MRNFLAGLLFLAPATGALGDVFDTLSDKGRAEAVASLLEGRFVATGHPDNVILYIKKARVEPAVDFEGRAAFVVRMTRQPLFKHNEPPARGNRVISLSSNCGEVVNEGMEKEPAYLNYLYVRDKETTEFRPIAAYVKLPELPDYYEKEAALTVLAPGMEKIEACKKQLDRKEESYPLAELTVLAGADVVYRLERFEPETIANERAWDPSVFTVKPRSAKDEVIVEGQERYAMRCVKDGKTSEAPELAPAPTVWSALKRKGPDFQRDGAFPPRAPVAKAPPGCAEELLDTTFRVRIGEKVLKTFVVKPVDEGID